MFPKDLTGNHQVVFISCSQDSNIPEHKHSFQYKIVVAGKVDLFMQGTKRTYTKGDQILVPGEIPHSAREGLRWI